MTGQPAREFGTIPLPKSGYFRRLMQQTGLRRQPERMRQTEAAGPEPLEQTVMVETWNAPEIQAELPQGVPGPLEPRPVSPGMQTAAGPAATDLGMAAPKSAELPPSLPDDPLRTVQAFNEPAPSVEPVATRPVRGMEAPGLARNTEPPFAGVRGEMPVSDAPGLKAAHAPHEVSRAAEVFSPAPAHARPAAAPPSGPAHSATRAADELFSKVRAWVAADPYLSQQSVDTGGSPAGPEVQKRLEIEAGTIRTNVEGHAAGKPDDPLDNRHAAATPPADRKPSPKPAAAPQAGTETEWSLTIGDLNVIVEAPPAAGPAPRPQPAAQETNRASFMEWQRYYL